MIIIKIDQGKIEFTYRASLISHDAKKEKEQLEKIGKILKVLNETPEGERK